MNAHRRVTTILAAAALFLTGCGGEPPETLAGFSLGLTQGELMEAARTRGGFGCRLRATRPKLTLCEGPSEEGVVRVLARGDSVESIALRLAPGADEEPRRVIRRFVKPFGEPAWRDRPVPPRAVTPEGYHTFWIDGDSARAIALSCAGTDLEPPCTAELTETTPAGVRAKLDTLLGIRR